MDYHVSQAKGIVFIPDPAAVQFNTTYGGSWRIPVVQSSKLLGPASERQHQVRIAGGIQVAS